MLASDIKPNWIQRYYREHHFKRWYTNSDYRRAQEQREAIIKKREETREKVFHHIDVYDTEQGVQNRRSDFWKEVHLLEYCGDLPLDRFWRDTYAFEVDKLRDLSFWCVEEELNIDYDWYCAPPENFNKVVKVLTPWAKQRPYGRVFFGTETRYLPKDKVLPLSAKWEIPGYCLVNNEKTFVPFVRKPRSDLFYPPRTGFYNYGSKKFNYWHTGTGILKRPTFECQRYRYIVNRIKTIQKDLTNKKDNPQRSIGATLFDEIRKSHFDIEHWSKNFSREPFTEQEKNTIDEHDQYQRYTFERISWQERKKIKRLVIGKVRNSNLIRRVQRAWRTRDPTKSKYFLRSSQIQRAWRCYRLRGIGSTFTIIGKIGQIVC